MSKTEVSPPAAVCFQTTLAVRVDDLNYGGHLANDAVLKLVHESRLRWLAALGFSETDIGGCGLIMTAAAVQYRAQAFHGDTLRADTGIAELSAAGFTAATLLVRTSDNVAVAAVRCRMAAFDYSAGRVRRLPQAFRERLADLAEQAV
ncbi:Uncharacterised protein [Kingella potus]|uniref:Acyl-CoA thioesterase YbgC n=1 Tax=Kingella potus TaxID=265175 RepID=A0A377R0G9_9NEIS|nr:thioesterase family protein [Kingella potus]UOP01061.1 thioesterase family protein [Kingella potus]STR00742.1 Uncharacterised protein [Kingella potus]